MSVKKIILTAHRWLGLTSGLVVFILAVTGCIYAFQQEIQDLTQPYRYTTAQDLPYMEPSALRKIAEAELPGKHIHSVIYPKPGRSVEAVFFDDDPEYYDIVYLNPYTGQVLEVKDVNSSFCRIILMGHYYLWLPHDIGQPIAASATLVFVIILISGIILWWPRNKSARKQRFSIKWNARWRRKNYDLHNVLGFYASWIVLFIALTGLVWGFEWFAQSAYAVAGGDKDIIYSEPSSEANKSVNSESAPNLIWQKMMAEYPEAETIEIHFAHSDSASIMAAINPDASTYWKMDYRYFDQYTLAEMPSTTIWGKYEDAEAADKMMRMNYDIHVGAIGGFTGKCIAFLASLIVASLPVTGFMIWYGKRKKEKKGVKVKKELQLSEVA